ncbi:MAG: DUF4912 domain-containing protein [Candidatus Omnitrophica bacterium]|nr:DUF4912 domain-containing protein [Candidatus Omnitrophota bacterium]
MRKKTSKTKASRITKIVKKIASKRNKAPILRKIVIKKAVFDSPAINHVLQQEPQVAAQAQFTATGLIQKPLQETYNLPVRYADNRIMLMPRDPWWLHTYWDLSESKINEVISAIPEYERHDLSWALRVYDVTSVKQFNGNNANSFFDIGIKCEANNWYINVNKPECSWCVEIGLKNPAGKFFPVARSNIIKTPYFGISSIIDEEWALPDEEYYKVLGVYDLGKSSMERKKRFEEILKHQISSPLASWGMSSLFSERKKVQDKFFLEVWTELILYGRTEHDAHVTVEGKPVNLRPDGTFSLRYALPVGDYKFEVVATSKSQKHKLKKTPAVKRFDK